MTLFHWSIVEDYYIHWLRLSFIKILLSNKINFTPYIAHGFFLIVHSSSRATIVFANKFPHKSHWSMLINFIVIWIRQEYVMSSFYFFVLITMIIIIANFHMFSVAISATWLLIRHMELTVNDAKRKRKWSIYHCHIDYIPLIQSKKILLRIDFFSWIITIDFDFADVVVVVVDV